MELLDDVQLHTDERGYFMCFRDDKTEEYRSLQELLEQRAGELAWETNNETVDDIPNARLIFQKEGRDEGGAEWKHSRVVN